MVKTQYENKELKNEEVKDTSELKQYSFPKEGRTIMASSYDEALRILNLNKQI